MNLPAVILGCGYTGSRVAIRLARRGLPVLAVSRSLHHLAGEDRIERAELDLLQPGGVDRLRPCLPEEFLLLHSLPVLDGQRELTREVLGMLAGRARRIVYLSTTAVYGDQRDVDETTRPAPKTPEARLRLEAEEAVLAAGCSSIVLRPAAIYGPGRGVHVSIPAGRYRMAGDGSAWVSRIHVDDLAALVEAALFSDVRGAWPVADEEPARQRDIAAFVCQLLGCAMPASAPPELLHRTLRSDRRVDGRAIFRLHGIALRYPSYRVGIPACLAAEGRAPRGALQSES
ncbi:MAG: NAD-dependent epimerase/dehydratase family protein [Bryobacteraceae bacterium]|nr:NAD-dependent epimerase/dehydratase family protein [Bryobacteraceae bacterium]